MSDNGDSYSAALVLYDQLVKTNPNLVRKGKTMPYTSVNGHMFSFLTKKGVLALRLPKDLRGDFLKEFKTELCVQHGRVMKEYAVVPDVLLHETKKMKKYFDLSYVYVSSLKPKPTKK
jgi:hypothetical protein